MYQLDSALDRYYPGLLVKMIVSFRNISMALLSVLLFSLQAVLIQARVYFTEPPSFLTKGLLETVVGNLNHTYKIGQTIQVTWNIDSLIVPNISLSLTKWMATKDDINYLLGKEASRLVNATVNRDANPTLQSTPTTGWFIAGRSATTTVLATTLFPRQPTTCCGS